ncbi:hypothetical protein [Ectothiorhodospira variabilis]|uniref:hypothetical protein n=1 Tax=Ectothiorhodospira variabilis TaxID=505694 RepID=UPI001EFA96DC|nr:hypothetical protein [Ectothiorhodospira variabilis]MCG5494418.1 hypothetical protein [Ectothiorhodospira variabilis]MCG5503211.1 hypothetical protein [Ectothiorhodospira variabilis]MCG5506030.1 hypothetical protein [Ectothiorhodospira variabilis]
MEKVESIERHPRGSRERLAAIVALTRQRREAAQRIQAAAHGGDPGIADLAHALWEIDPIKLTPADLDRISAAAVNVLHESIPDLNQRQLETLAYDLATLSIAVRRQLVAAEQEVSA